MKETKQIKVTKTVVYDVDSIKLEDTMGEAIRLHCILGRGSGAPHKLYDRRC